MGELEIEVETVREGIPLWVRVSDGGEGVSEVVPEGRVRVLGVTVRLAVPVWLELSDELPTRDTDFVAELDVERRREQDPLTVAVVTLWDTWLGVRLGVGREALGVADGLCDGVAGECVGDPDTGDTE